MTSSLNAPAPLNLSISSQLIQDYLYTSEPPPPALAERGSLVAIDGGLLAIDGPAVTHFELEPTSEGGWKTTTITVPVPPTAANTEIMMIKAFTIDGNEDWTTPASTLNLLCFFAAQGWAEGGGKQAAYAVAWLVREPGGTWQEALLNPGPKALLSQVQSLDIVDAGVGLGKFVYGMTTSILGQQNVQLFVLKIWNYNEITTVPWQIASQQAIPNLLAGRAVFLASGDVAAPRSVSLCLCFDNGSETMVTWSPPLPVDPGSGPDLSGNDHFGFTTIPTTLREFLPLNGRSEWAAIAVDSNGLIYRLGFPPDIDQSCAVAILNQGAGPTAVTEVAATRRVGQSTSLFAVANERLWLTRDIENVNWVELGDPAVQLATPGHDPTVFEVFYAATTTSGGNQIYHLSQDTGRTVWKRQTLAIFQEAVFAPSGSGPKEVGTISIELSATHQDSGQAARNALISVSADQWVVLLAGKLSYWVGPGTDQQIPADQLGSLNIRYRAIGLTFPHLTFYATEQGRPNSPTVGCSGDAVDGNQNPSTSTVANRLAGNGDGAEFTMNTAALQNNHLLPGTADDDKTTNCLKQLGGYMAGAHAASVAGATKTLSLGGFDDDAGDVMNWLKHTTEDLGDFAVTIADGVATVVVGIYKFTVKTARQAGDAIGTICAKVMSGLRELEDVLKDLIEFLKMLFEWKDILDTHKALKTLLTWGINYIPANSGKVASWVDSRLSVLGNDISGAIAKAEAYLQQNDLTANGYARRNNLKTPGQTQPDLGGSIYQTHLANHKSRCNYVLSRAKPHVTAVTPKPGNTASISDAMNAGFAGPNITGQQTTFLNAVQTLLCPDGVADATRILDASALALLQLSKDLINAAVLGLEAVVKAVLEALASAAEWFASTLSDPIDIPVVSWIYSAVVEDTLNPSNNDLSVLDLFCLILAVPVTVIYKLIRNGEAPFGGPRVAAMQAAFGDPANTNFAALANFGSASLLAASAADDLALASEVLGCVAGGLCLFSGVVGTFADLIAMVNQAIEGESTPAQALIAWVSWGVSTLTTLCEAPISTFAGFSQGGNLPTEIAKTVFFGLEVLPSIGDFICLAASKTSVMRMLPNSGAYWDGACGFVILGAAVAYIFTAAIEQQDGPWDALNAVLSNINRPFRVIMPGLTGFDIPAALVIIPVVLASDVAATVGGTVTQIGSSVRG